MIHLLPRRLSPPQGTVTPHRCTEGVFPKKDVPVCRLLDSSHPPRNSWLALTARVPWFSENTLIQPDAGVLPLARC